MIQLSRWKVILVAASLFFGILLALPNLLSPAQREALPGFMPKSALNLGLDLQGGSYLLLEVDVAEMQTKRIDNLVEDVRQTLREDMKLPFPVQVVETVEITDHVARSRFRLMQAKRNRWGRLSTSAQSKALVTGATCSARGDAPSPPSRHRRCGSRP